MEINGIPSNSTTPPVATQPAALTPTKSKETPPQHDTVTLSGAALAKSLKQSGLTAAQIALKMHLSVETVDQYLGITTNAVTTTSLPPTTPVPQAK
jgi:DNA-binding NarL/FixJ family response regulator